MKNTVRQHIPGYVDQGMQEPKVANFETVDELLAVPWVDHWRHKENTGHDFHRFSKNDDRLLVECDGGNWWWVIGYLDRPHEVDLPKLAAGRK